MKDKKLRKRLSTNSKINIIMLFLVFFSFLFIYRLYALQVLDVYDYKNKGNQVSYIGRVQKAKRGNIFDRNKNPLAVSQDTENLYLLPITTKEKSTEAELLLQDEEKVKALSVREKEDLIRLSNLPVYDEKEIEKIAQTLELDIEFLNKKFRDGGESYIYKSLTKTQKEKIELLGLNYLLFLKDSERFYPNKDLLSSTLGFIDSDGNASYGLEAFYDQVLSGESGYSEFYKALRGTEIPYEKSKKIDPVDGQNLITTIDIELQKIVSRNLKNAFFDYKPMKAIAILSNPNNGEILAMESLPNFDSNSPRSINSDIDNIFLKNLDEDKEVDYMINRWNNNAVSMQYDPGSVFKIITTAIVLEADNTLKNKIYEDKGYIDLAEGVRIRSWRYWDPHGPQNLRDALMNSSNPVFVQLANDVGKEKYVEYAQVYNFGKKTGIDLPNEAEGYFPKDSNISDVDFGTLSYGHYSNETPIQLLAAINSTINGGKYYKPHLLKSIVNDNDTEIYTSEIEYLGKTVSESTSSEIRDYLEYTADNYGMNNTNIKFGAKTGSTIKYTKDSIFGNSEDSESNTLITSIFAISPAKAPKYSLLLVFDEAQGVSTSAEITISIAQKIFEEIFEQEGNKVEKIDQLEETIEVPNLIGLTLEEAINVSNNLGLNLTTEDELGRFHIVTSQFPERKNLISKNGKIKIGVGSQVKMPDIVGKEINEISELFKLNKITYKIEGEGSIVENQSVIPNQIFDSQDIVIIKLKEKE